MVEVGEIKAVECFPSDYKIYRVGDNIELTVGDTVEYIKIKNRAKIEEEEKQDTTNWLMAADATEYNAGDISDWLEPEEDVFYNLAFSIESDRDVEVRIFVPASAQLFGTKKNPDMTITPSKSPRSAPTVTLRALGTTYIPNFRIKNPTEYTIAMLKFFVKGYKYEYEKIAKPATFDRINLNAIS